MTAPLRRVLEPDYPTPGALYGTEPLECGHWITLSSGWSYAERRRCRKCERGEPRQFDPQSERETWEVAS